jgi:DNA invertase Pin-like site-specific DNA recombinase
MESLKKYVAYYRVSTQKQGASGFGLEGQQAAVKSFVGSNVLVSEFTEIETGKNDNRKELDRLSRNAFFVMKLQSEKVAFVCCDNPHANELTIGILAVIAQDEAKRISERTKAALTAKKARLVAEGKNENWRTSENQKWSNEAREKGMQTIKEKAASNVHIKRAKRYAAGLREKGLTLEAIANQLNEDGFQTAKGKSFHKTSVMRLLTE